MGFDAVNLNLNLIPFFIAVSVLLVLLGAGAASLVWWLV